MTPTAERGSATVWMVALAGVLAMLGTAAVLGGAAVVARHRATAAADLAALAAAGGAVTGSPDPCALAADVAAANGADLTGCGVSAGAVVEIEVSVPVRLAGLGVHRAQARARAGPLLADPAASVQRVRPVGVLGGPLGGEQFVEDHVEHPHRAGLVERVVAVAALG